MTHQEINNISFTVHLLRRVAGEEDDGDDAEKEEAGDDCNQNEDCPNSLQQSVSGYYSGYCDGPG